jgi:PTH2 family peptidyl-tRNA hydrolase
MGLDQIYQSNYFNPKYMPIEPNPFDDERLANIRSEQGDPIIQYYIVRTDLNMSSGKIAAQVAHGAQMFLLEYLNLKYKEIQETIELDMGPAQKHPRVLVVEKWLNGSFRKVVLRGNQKDFDKIKKELDIFLVRDAGLTEIEPNSETVLVTWPILRSECPKILKRLQTLK